MILKLSWLQKVNLWINWANNELCSVNEAYEIMKQSEVCLLKHKLWNHEISLLPEKKLMWKLLYSMSEDQLKEVHKYLNKNLKQKFIKLSKSLTEYSILFVLKKNDKKWWCVNYRHLNDITKQDSYSLLLIEELQKCLEDAKWFIKLNLHKTYYQVCMKEGEEWKTAFWTKYRHYEYTVMSFELKNVSVTFQQLINDTV